MESQLSGHGALIGRAIQALSEHYAGAPVRLDEVVSVRENSEVFRAVVETETPFAVAIKHCFRPRTKIPDESAAREQYAALDKVDCALKKGASRYRVPTPLLLIPELATIVMPWLDGESLTQKMRRPAIFTKGPEWFEAVGAWIGNFHKLGPARHRQVDLDERIEILKALENSPLPEQSFSKAIGILRNYAPGLEQLAVETSWLHGDCKTDNFFLSGVDVFGIDISLCYENAVEYDIAQFFNNLDLMLSSPQTVYLGVMQSRLEKAFWRGYRVTGPSVSLPYLNWLRLSFALSFWHSMLNGRETSIRNRVLNRMFAKLIVRLSRIVDSSHRVGSFAG